MRSRDDLIGRRDWLRRAGLFGGALGTLGAGALGNLLAPARSALASDYRALLCISLYGGNDGLNMVVPNDAARYAQYSEVRRALAIPRASLLSLHGTDYGLHPAMSALLPAWNDGALAPVFNVGPLHEPLTKAAYLAAAPGANAVPDSLFSHAQQQALWDTSTTDAQTRTGWGGRAAETLAMTNPVISVGSSCRYGVSSTSGPLVLPGPGAHFGALELGTESWRLQDPSAVARAVALRAMYDSSQDNDLADVQAGIQRNAFAMSARLGALVRSQPGDSDALAIIQSAFAPVIVGTGFSTPLAAQLYQVAKLVANNATVQGNRQIFFAELGGFDTHANQVAATSVDGQHAALLKTLADALGCFYSALKNLGMSRAVTTFTQSDFGRTFAPNNSLGTDHAWGNHQLVLGGALHGGQTYGHYPSLVLGGDDDVGVQRWELQGRWIPSSSVDQYASTLLNWFGATALQVNAVLPNLQNFGASRTLQFL